MTRVFSSLTDKHINEEDCRSIQCVVELIGQRWTGAILIAAARGARRFTEYRAMVTGVSDRLLTARLKELEAEQLMERTVIPSTPVQIRYALTPLGAELVGALQPLMDFSLRHIVAPSAR